jgi:4-carboxymuconolactone decarboxylase
MTEHQRRRARGEKAFRDIMERDALPPDDLFCEFTIEELFADVWSRPGLTRKERRWITMTIVASSAGPVGLAAHLEPALASGDITREELMEWLLHFMHYAGWARGSDAYQVMRGVFARLDAGPAPEGGAG